MITPLHDKVLIKRLEINEKTEGGIILPQVAKGKSMEGKVVAVGPGKLLEDGKRHGCQVKKGDHVLFAPYAGTEVKHDGEEYMLMSESDIMAIIR